MGRSGRLDVLPRYAKPTLLRVGHHEGVLSGQDGSLFGPTPFHGQRVPSTTPPREMTQPEVVTRTISRQIIQGIHSQASVSICHTRIGQPGGGDLRQQMDYSTYQSNDIDDIDDRRDEEDNWCFRPHPRARPTTHPITAGLMAAALWWMAATTLTSSVSLAQGVVATALGGVAAAAVLRRRPC